jgi:small-conductance mechanosensitive channel
VEEDRTQENQQATAVFEQWTRAEPGFRQLTSEEVDAGMATWDAEFEARNAERDRQQAARVALYDEGREQARLALLEQQAILRHCSQKLDDLRERRRFPAMPEQPRRAQIAELQQSVAAARTAVVRLQEQVGDVETVVDQHGWLPQERRELALSLFSARRCSEVRELRERVREQPTTLQATKGRAERARRRDAVVVGV